MSLIPVGSISLDSTFKGVFLFIPFTGDGNTVEVFASMTLSGSQMKSWHLCAILINYYSMSNSCRWIGLLQNHRIHIGVE
jgi:hypothetical protein